MTARVVGLVLAFGLLLAAPARTEPARAGGGNSPAWSPDGLRIAFSAYNQDDRQKLWVMDADGSHQRRLTGANDFDEDEASWSRGGRRIAFMSNRFGGYTTHFDVLVINQDGFNLRRVTRTTGFDGRPSWSPDGRIAFQSRRAGETDIFVSRVDGSGLRRLTTSRAFDGDAAWSPNGRLIAFASNRSGKPGDRQLWVMRSDGTRQRQLTFTTGPKRGPSWAPDSMHLVFSRSLNGSSDLYTTDFAGNVHRLTRTRRYEADGAWSPDGRHIAFTGISDDGYQYQVWVMNADGTGRRPLTR